MLTFYKTASVFKQSIHEIFRDFLQFDYFTGVYEGFDFSNYESNISLSIAFENAVRHNGYKKMRPHVPVHETKQITLSLKTIEGEAMKRLHIPQKRTMRQ